VNGGSLFLVNVLLGRLLVREEYGIFSLAVLLLSTVAEISDLGLNAGLLRFAPYYIAGSEHDKLKQLVKTIWQWRVGLSIILTVGGMALSYPIARYLLGQPQITAQVAFAFIGVGGVILLGFVTTYLQAKQAFLRVAVVQSLKGLLRLVCIAILLACGVRNIFSYIAVYTLVPWILFASQFRHLPHQFWLVRMESVEKKKLHDQLANFSVWLTLWSILSIISSRVDQVMVSHLLGLEQVAIFTVAYQLMQFFPIITQSVTSVLTPRVNGFRNKSDLIVFVRKSLRWVTTLAIIIGIAIVPSQYIIRLLFGAKYIAAMPIYVILAMSLTLNLLVIPFSLIIYAFNKTRYMTVSGVIQLVVNVLGNFYFITTFGLIGAAYTFVLGIVCSVLYNIVCAIYLIKQEEIVVL
jgi:PST family polysaccharide transporter